MLMLMLFLWIAHLLFLQELWIHVVLPVMQTLVTFISLFVFHYIASVRHRIYLRQVFGTYVDPKVVEQVIRDEQVVGLGGDERDMSVLFMDIEGFTSFSEQLEPQQVVSYINRFFDAATPVIHRHGGCIDRLTGDGLIALFGAPLKDEKHAVHACRAALELNEVLRTVEQPGSGHSGHPLAVRIGINSGRLVVGNMGASERVQYTFMGDAGNTAARLESLNKQYGTRRMIGEATWRQVNQEFVCRELDRVILVGKQEPLTIYQLLAEGEEDGWNSLLNAYAVAVTAYRSGNFTEAAALFADVEERFDDRPSGMMKLRCEELAKTTPEQWNGIWGLQRK